MKVCVIGAGSAGREAAREAARIGAEVTMVDSHDPPLPDWQSWPELVGPGEADPQRGRQRLPGVNCAFGTRVVSVGRGGAMTEAGGRLVGDALVVAAGPAFEGVPLQGRSKPGVSVLDAPRGYAQLGLDASSGERVVITGEGGRSMQVAERVATGRRRVTLLLSSWQHGAPSPTSMGALLDAAARRGVSVQGAKVARALGARSLEAVLVRGEVVPCDVLAVVPRRVPGPVPGAATGRHGGVEVGLDMRSAVPGVLSAGGCAELHEGSPPHATLEDEEGPSGRVAGANAAGHRARLSAARCFSCSAFGVTWTRLGTGAAPARAAGLDAVAIGRRDAESACTIVYDRATGAVLGLETVEARYSSGPVAASMGPFTTLRSLAYEGSLGSSDISMVSETARLGLEAWSRS